MISLYPFSANRKGLQLFIRLQLIRRFTADIIIYRRFIVGIITLYRRFTVNIVVYRRFIVGFVVLRPFIVGLERYMVDIVAVQSQGDSVGIVRL